MPEWMKTTSISYSSSYFLININWVLTSRLDISPDFGSLRAPMSSSAVVLPIPLDHLFWLTMPNKTVWWYWWALYERMSTGRNSSSTHALPKAERFRKWTHESESVAFSPALCHPMSYPSSHSRSMHRSERTCELWHTIPSDFKGDARSVVKARRKTENRKFFGERIFLLPTCYH